MRVILSRKGLDSDFGGMPSPIMPDGQVLSIPIPGDPDEIPYSAVRSRFDGKTIPELAQSLSPTIRYNRKRILWSENPMCHLDPDLSACSYPRLEGWRGCFGQGGAAQTVLEKAGVKAGDVFLFFGWFRNTEWHGGKLRFCSGQGFHMIYGYLQVGNVYYPQKSSEPIPDWLAYHPHTLPRRLENPNNCIYIASERASWDAGLPGYGLFPAWEESLVLSKPGMTRSRWSLPEEFRGLRITYHSESSWKDGYFQSSMRGQEFVLQEDERVQAWARKMVDAFAVRVKQDT